MEEKVTEKVTGQLKPKIAEIQQQAKINIRDAVQKEITSVDIPNLIHTEVQNLFSNIKLPKRNEEDDADQKEINRVDIPSLINQEVQNALSKLKLPERVEEDDLESDV